MFDNEYIVQRIQKSSELKNIGKNPYQNIVYRDIVIGQFFEKFADIEERDENQKVNLIGRIKFLRHMGKASFAKIEDESGVVQIYFSKNELGEWYEEAKRLIEVGDIVSSCGYPFKTKTGELTLHSNSLEIVTKSIIPLPEKFHGLVDKEIRYKQRYLDLIVHPDVKNTFKTRSKIVSLIRHFFEDCQFLEVETPMLHPIPSGANARPFITHHNALGVDRYLRIAPELYLKRLIVGGFEAVFEINRNFRNEGMDATHNPEFTMIEFYWAYKRYEDLMKLTEDLFDFLFSKLNLPKVITYEDREIDFSTPFRKIKYIDSIVEIGNINSDIVNNSEKIIQFLNNKNIKIKNKNSLGELQAQLFDNFVEEKLINPTFIVEFPIEISPLARRNDLNPEIADRFELFIASKEIANGFSELNDPLDQLGRFQYQMEAKASGEVEVCEMDEDYVRALGYGMPPTAGEGIGIDRLVMLLTNQHSIRDVLLFPAMREAF